MAYFRTYDNREQRHCLNFARFSFTIIAGRLLLKFNNRCFEFCLNNML